MLNNMANCRIPNQTIFQYFKYEPYCHKTKKDKKGNAKQRCNREKNLIDRCHTRLFLKSSAVNITYNKETTINDWYTLPLLRT